MANNLTGDYEAVLQVSVRQINGLLATLHQDKAAAGASPTFLHSESFRVGDTPAAWHPGIREFSKWLVSDQALVSIAPDRSGSGWSADFDKAPPGMAERLRDAYTKWHDAIHEVVAPDTVRGRAQVQISSPTISLVEGSTSKVNVSVFVRAHYYPDPDSQLIQAPVHGEVSVTYEVQPKSTSGQKVLHVPVPTQDSAIQFIPESGTVSAAEAAEITNEVRKVLRNRFEPIAVDLPAEFPLFGFRAIGGANSRQDPGQQAIALPVQLSDWDPPVGDIDSITAPLLKGNDDFAIAVSKDYVESKLKPTLDRLRQFRQLIEISLPDPMPNATYRFSVTSVNLQWNNGWIDLKIAAKATTPHELAPNFENISINQRLTLTLDATKTVSLNAPDSDLTITGVPSVAEGHIIAERNAALPPAGDDIRASLSNGKDQLNAGLQSVDKSAKANYTGIEITPDGIIVRGAIETKWHYGPVVVIRECDDVGVEVEARDGSGTKFTALHSWIPGGRITNYVWSWVETPVFVDSSGRHYTIPWWGKVIESPPEPHRFIVPKPEKVKGLPLWAALHRICLRVEGTQITADGHAQPIWAQTACQGVASEPLVTLPPGLENPLIPIWQPPHELSADALLEESIAGHIAASTDAPPPGGFSTNHLVHFADWRADFPLRGLQRVLSQMRRSESSLAVVVVLPVGSLHTTRREFEARLGLRESTERRESLETREGPFPVPFQVTEDYEGSWTRTFGAQDVPATFLINARGEFVWKQVGEVDPERLAAALDEYLLPAPTPKSRLIKLAVRPGDRLPDAFSEENRWQVVELRQFRGQQILLNFWQSWSKPCIQELRRLQSLRDRTDKDAPLILAYRADKESRTLTAVRDQYELSFSVIHDRGQRMARLFKVFCWPTTVSINPEGIVDHIQFGVSPEHESGVDALTS